MISVSVRRLARQQWPDGFLLRLGKYPDVEARLDPLTLDRMFHALADASRRTMVDRLARGPASVSELALPLAMGMPAVLKHLGVLEAGGIVVSEKAGRVRTYRMTPRALALAESWVSERMALLDRVRDDAPLPIQRPAPSPAAQMGSMAAR
jgi:DNA-binding transcriptional ArsR family regulator